MLVGVVLVELLNSLLGRVVGTGCVTGGSQLACERVEVSVRRVVLQSPGDLRLLCFGPAAPHGETPLCVVRNGIACQLTPPCHQTAQPVRRRCRSWSSRYVHRATDAASVSAARTGAMPGVAA